MSMGLMAWLGLNISNFSRNLGAATGQAKAAGGTIASSIGGSVAGKLASFGSAAAIGASVRAAMDYADVMGDIASRLGISAEAAQAWDQALQLNGSSIQEAVPFFERLAVMRQKAVEGNENAIASFSKFGITLEMLKSKAGTEDIAIKIAKAFEGADPQALIADFRELGGKSAGSMVAAFRGGLADMVQATKESVAVMSQDTVDSLKNTGDTFKSMWAEIRAGIGTVTAKPLELLAKGLTFLKDGVAVTAAAAGGYSVGGKAGAKEAVNNWEREKEAAAEREREAARAGGKPPAAAEDEIKATKEINDLRKKLEDKQTANAMATMTSQEKMVALEKRRAEINEEINNAKTDKDKLEAQLELADVDKDIWNTGKEVTSAGAKGGKGMAKPDLNALQRIGAYASAPEMSMLDVNRKQEAHLEAIKQTLVRMESKGAKGTPGGTTF